MSWAKALISAEEQARIVVEKEQESSSYMRTNRTRRSQINLTVTHTDTPLGLKRGLIYRWLTIEVADSPFTYRLESPSGAMSAEFIGTGGASLAQHDFVEIYVSNSIGTGEGVIQVGWRE